MHIGRVFNATRVLGQAQGYLGLPIRDEKIRCSVNGADMPSMVSAWLPTPAELRRIAAGAPVHVRILGTAHPPIMVEVGDAPAND